MKILSKVEVKIELESIVSNGNNDISLDIEDINLITKNKDLVVMGVYENCSDEAAYKVISSMVSDFEDNELSLMNVDGILLYFQISSSYNLTNLTYAMEIIDNKCDTVYITDEPYIIFGTSCDDSLDIDYVKATVFMGYSAKENLKPANNFIEVAPI